MTADAATLEPQIVEMTTLALEGQWEKVEPRLKTLLDAGWDRATCVHAMADAAMCLGKMDQAITRYRHALKLNPRNIHAQENLIFLIDAQPNTTQWQAAAERWHWWDRFGRYRYDQRKPHTNVADPEKRLRVGYVTSDFRVHSASIGYGHVITGHTDQIEPVYYCTLPAQGWTQNTIAYWKDLRGFVDVSEYNAATLADIVRDDQIDILVDLAGYTAGNRLLTFAHKPAPVQVTAWGYATGVGWQAMDALFSDPIVGKGYLGPERVVNLPSVITLTPRPGLPEANPLPCLSAPPVFAVYQRAMKLHKGVLDVYAEILRRVPGSQLVFKANDYLPIVRTAIVKAMDDVRGQITFISGTSHLQHQHCYLEADLSLDPWPQTGGISTLEGAHMGVPTLTLIGPRVIQRASASIMTNLGLPDFVARTKKDYIEKAVALVTTDRERLAGIRQTLRATLEASPIRAGYVDAVEAAYRKLWRVWCARQEAKAA